ncbi:MAG: hypothetical protein AAGF07_01670 [Patescibacteria group bacterium]
MTKLFFVNHLINTTGLLSFNLETIKLVIALLLLFVTVLLTCITVMLFSYILNVNKDDHVGYLPSSLKAVKDPIRQIISIYVGEDKTKDYTLVEPGAGAANVSYFLSQKYKWKQVLAIEDEISLVWYSKLKNLFRKKPVSLVKANIFNYSFPTKSVVYCYLLSEMLAKLYEQGQLAGSLVISLSFPLKKAEPTEVFELSGFQKYLYVYDFR